MSLRERKRDKRRRNTEALVILSILMHQTWKISFCLSTTKLEGQTTPYKSRKGMNFDCLGM